MLAYTRLQVVGSEAIIQTAGEVFAHTSLTYEFEKLSKTADD